MLVSKEGDVTMVAPVDVNSGHIYTSIGFRKQQPETMKHYLGMREQRGRPTFVSSCSSLRSRVPRVVGCR